MTTQQFDNACYKAHELIDQQGCVCIKAIMSQEDFGNFMHGCRDLTSIVDYQYSYMGNDTAYVYALVLNTGDYDEHEYAGLIMSKLAYYGAKKIESI